LYIRKRYCRLDVALASSYTLTEQSLLLKSVKIGILGRVLSVFRVDNVLLYVDRAEAWREASLIKRVLEYMVTAPYLRRYVYPPHVPELRYAGVLPPLQLPTHGVGGPREGEVREALVLRPVKQGVIVEAGLGRPVLVKNNKAYRRGQRVLVEIKSLNPLVIVPAETDIYSGFRVRVENSLRSLIQRHRKTHYIIATSRKGEVIDFNKLRENKDTMCRKGVLVVFGSPDKGLFELARQEGFELEGGVDEVLNTIPSQGTRTVRVEEAITATLSILNLVLE